MTFFHVPKARKSNPNDVIIPISYDVNLVTRLPKTGIFSNRKVDLEIAGQGTVSYDIFPSKIPTCTIRLNDGAGQSLLKIEVSDRSVELKGREAANFKCTPTKEFHFDLVQFETSCRYIWVSICKYNEVIKLGHGYMMELNTLFNFTPVEDREDWALMTLKSVKSIELQGPKLASQPKYWRLPVIMDAPPIILPTDKLTLIHIAKNLAIPPESLPLEGRRLYANVGGTKVELSTEDVAAINYSLDTEGCALHEKLKAKSIASYGIPDSKMTYIRATIGVNRGDSTGVPYVLEIWPKEHSSPVHMHGDAVAVIKVLHGSLVCSWFNPLPKKRGKNETPQRIKESHLEKGDITWMSPEFYQTHKLFNYRNDSMTATIQCYGYLGGDIKHHETFDYVIDKDTTLHYFQPRSDFDYETLMGIVRKEYSEKKQKKWYRKIWNFLS